MGSPHEITLELRAIPEAPGVARVADADGGWARVSLDLDPRAADLQAIRQRRASREVRARVSELLRTLVEPAGWSQRAEGLAGAVARGERAVVQVLSDLPEVHALPWELLPLGSAGGYLGEVPGVVIHQAWPGTVTTPERPSSGALLAWSAAGGAVPDAVFAEALRKAPALGGFSAGRDTLADAGLAAISRALSGAEREGHPKAALVLLCHVTPLDDGGLGLALHGPDGGLARVSPEDLRRTLRPFTATLRLVVLALAEEPEPGPASLHTAALGMALHAAGVRAVIVPRHPLSVRAICTWSLAAFDGLQDLDAGLDRAMALGRAALGADAMAADWASPALLMRAADLQVGAARPRPPAPDRNWVQGLAAAAGLLLVGVLLWNNLPLGHSGPYGPPEEPEPPPPPAPPPPVVGLALTAMAEGGTVPPAALREALAARELAPCLAQAPPPSETGIVGRVFWLSAAEGAEGPPSVLVPRGPGEGVESCVARALSGLDATDLGGTGPLGFELAVLPAGSAWVRGAVPLALGLSGGAYGSRDRDAVRAALEAALPVAARCLDDAGADTFTVVGDPRGRLTFAFWRLSLEVAPEGRVVEARLEHHATVEPPPSCLVGAFEGLELGPAEGPETLSVELKNRNSETPYLR